MKPHIALSVWGDIWVCYAPDRKRYALGGTPAEAFASLESGATNKLNPFGPRLRWDGERP